MSNYYSVINEELRKLAGLEKLYPYSIDASTAGPRLYSGLCHNELGIVLSPRLSDEGAQVVYLHEVAHLIDKNCRFDDMPNYHAHNKYFGVLVAVMYRRAGLLRSLKVYDFAETPTTGYDGQPALDDELIRRFNFIINESGRFSGTAATIEQIAKYLHRYHIASKPAKRKTPKPIRWTDLIIGVFLGVSGTAAIVVTSASWLLL
jgi:hypothetical protein